LGGGRGLPFDWYAFGQAGVKDKKKKRKPAKKGEDVFDSAQKPWKKRQDEVGQRPHRRGTPKKKGKEENRPRRARDQRQMQRVGSREGEKGQVSVARNR